MHAVAPKTRAAFVIARDFAHLRVASPLQSDTIMIDPAPSEKTPERQEVVRAFTVLRGMAVAIVIETHDWYSAGCKPCSRASASKD